eukprot:gene338-450_t
MPFFCEDRFQSKLIWDDQFLDANRVIPADAAVQEAASFIVDPVWQKQVDNIQNPADSDLYYVKLPGCCQCERHIIPYYFQDDTQIDQGYPDNKHGFVQLEILAVEHSELTVVIELLNGQYYQDFDQNIPDKSDIWVHSPNRANYNQQNFQQNQPSRNAFITLLDFPTLTGANIALPLNLPMSQTRVPGFMLKDLSSASATFYTFELKILVGRVSDIYQGDKGYQERYKEHRRVEYLLASEAYSQALAERGEQGNYSSVVDFLDFADVPDTVAISSLLYQIADPNRDVEVSSFNDPSGLTFLGLPYLPFFSN